MAKRTSKGNLSTSTSIVEATLTETPSTAIATIVEAASEDTTGAQEGATDATPSTPERIPLTILAISGARKEGKETIIHSSLWGKERWFAKKRLHSYTNLGQGNYLLLIPTSELNYRDAELTEPLANTTPFEGFEGGTLPDTFTKGGAYEILNAGY